MGRLVWLTRRLQALFIFAVAVGAFEVATGERIHTLPSAENSESTYLRVIVVGATGDLAAKYLWVACFRLALEMRLSYGQRVLFTAAARDSQEEGDRWVSQFFTSDWAARVCGQEEIVGSSTCRVFYTREFVPAIQYATLATREQYEALSGALRRQDSQLREEGLTEARRVVYLAIPPQAFLQASQYLSEFLRPTQSDTFFRVVIEKPFGRDLASAERLASGLRSVLSTGFTSFNQDDEMLLMDHYAGKPGLRVIAPFVRSNADTLGRIWNGHFIQKIEIQMSETETCEHRLEYFDSNGIVRDVMANHLQLLLGAVIAPSLRHCRSTPSPRRALGEDILDDLCPHEMTRFVQSLRPLGSVLVGQYEGYNQERTSNRSITATAAFTHIKSTSADWVTTSFSISAAKATATRRADVRVTFKLGPSVHDNGVPCLIMFTIQNGAGSSGERVQVQCAGLGELNAPASWSLSKAPGEFIPTASLHKQSTATTLPWQLGNSISAYDSLLADAAHGRCDSFMKIDEVLAAWVLWSPIVRAAELVASESIVTYPIGATAWRHFEGIHGTCPLTTPWAPRRCLRRDAASTQPLARGT